MGNKTVTFDRDEETTNERRIERDAHCSAAFVSSSTQPKRRMMSIAQLSTDNAAYSEHSFQVDAAEKTEKAFKDFMQSEGRREEEARNNRSLEEILEETRRVLRTFKKFNDEGNSSEEEEEFVHEDVNAGTVMEQRDRENNQPVLPYKSSNENGNTEPPVSCKENELGSRHRETLSSRPEKNRKKQSSEKLHDTTDMMNSRSMKGKRISNR